MNNYLLYEIGVEEFPSRFVDSTLTQLKDNLSKELTERRITFSEIETYTTPRRLVLLVKDLSEKQTDLEEEIKGPAKKIAVAEDGSLTRAALGFMRGKGLEEKDIYYKELDGNEYLYATIKEEGLATTEILKEVLPSIITKVVFPKAMRWGGKSVRFVRPIRWLLCLMNDEVVPVDLEGIVASNKTVGHRFLGEKSIEVSSYEDYLEKLRANFVILNQDERKALIRKQMDEVATSINGIVDMDEELLTEVTYIVEYPTAFYGEFDKKYLALPKEVVKTPMKAHQRYFPVVDKNDDLLPYFIAVRNGNDYKIENVKKGNEKVLEARLADALFFFKEDTLLKLEDYRAKLDSVVFQEKLGTLLDKSNRLCELAKKVEDKFELDKVKFERATYLAKADLVTGMVFEFDELQGYMGKEYAKKEGEDKLVAEAIYEHYLPRFSGDKLPETVEGAILSILDKMDTIAGFFAIGITPTGSADPFALRRQSLGILTILLEKNIDMDIEEMAKLALSGYSNIEFNEEEVLKGIMDFFDDRIRILFKAMGIRYDVVESVLSYPENNVSDLYTRADAINKWIDRDTLTDMMVAFNRVSTLAEKAESEEIKPELLKEASEKKLYEDFMVVNKEITELMNEKEYTKSLNVFASLKGSIDEFFESVMVMDEDINVRNNRLALLKAIYNSMLHICDLTKIVYK